MRRSRYADVETHQLAWPEDGVDVVCGGRGSKPQRRDERPRTSNAFWGAPPRRAFTRWVAADVAARPAEDPRPAVGRAPAHGRRRKLRASGLPPSFRRVRARHGRREANGPSAAGAAHHLNVYAHPQSHRPRRPQGSRHAASLRIGSTRSPARPRHARPRSVTRPRRGRNTRRGRARRHGEASTETKIGDHGAALVCHLDDGAQRYQT